MSSLRLIGFWKNEAHPEYPDPQALIDDKWDTEERDQLGWYLSYAFLHSAWMGFSPCRICGKNNGALQLTDGTYVWPEGLRHYVDDHHVRLPQEFVRHALCKLEEVEGQVVEDSWWLEQTR